MVHGFFDMTFSSLEKITDGQILQFNRERKISHLFIDSRKPVLDQEALFFAITGEHHNGHTYIDQLYALGVRQFVIEQDISISDLSDANILRVRGTVHALQQIATAHREMFSG